MELTKKQIAEYAKQYPHVSKTTIKVNARDYKTERGLVNYLKKANADNEVEHSKPLPIYVVIDVNWAKNNTWGSNPTASICWEDADGRWHRDDKAGHASGCGYDKHSAAVAAALNKHFQNLLYSIRNKRTKNKPYGISYYEGSFPYFEGGVGMSCYPRIMEWLGYKMTHVAWTKTYDKWVIVKNSHKKNYSL